jgi:hypothetical protein
MIFDLLSDLPDQSAGVKPLIDCGDPMPLIGESCNLVCLPSYARARRRVNLKTSKNRWAESV